jgi:hypothetical protein
LVNSKPSEPDVKNEKSATSNRCLLLAIITLLGANKSRIENEFSPNETVSGNAK